MRRRDARRLVLPVLLAGASAGCFAGEPKLEMPPAEKVESVDVMQLRGPGGTRQVTEFSDTERVRRLVEYVARERAWEPVTGSFPAADYTLTFTSWSGQPLVVLRIGQEWMGGSEIGSVLSGGSITTIGADERRYLLQLAGVPGV